MGNNLIPPNHWPSCRLKHQVSQISQSNIPVKPTCQIISIPSNHWPSCRLKYLVSQTSQSNHIDPPSQIFLLTNPCHHAMPSCRWTHQGLTKTPPPPHPRSFNDGGARSLRSSRGGCSEVSQISQSNHTLPVKSTSQIVSTLPVKSYLLSQSNHTYPPCHILRLINVFFFDHFGLVVRGTSYGRKRTKRCGRIRR